MSKLPGFGMLLGNTLERLDYRVGRINYSLYNAEVVGESEHSIRVRGTEVDGDGGQVVERSIARWAIEGFVA